MDNFTRLNVAGEAAQTLEYSMFSTLERVKEIFIQDGRSTFELGQMLYHMIIP